MNILVEIDLYKSIEEVGIEKTLLDFGKEKLEKIESHHLRNQCLKTLDGIKKIRDDFEHYVYKSSI